MIGIDIGGTKIRGISWDGKRALKALEIATPKNLSGFKSTLIKLVKFLSKKNLHSSDMPRENKIAIGAAGIIRGTTILKAPNIPYIKNFDFSNIKELASFDKILDNDARCFARAEYKINNTIKAKTTLFMILGTGIGRAIGKNGKILKIKKFEYPETWEREYQKISNSKNNKKLAEYISKKLINQYHPQILIIGGGILARDDFFTELKKILKISIKKSKLGKNAVAIGAALLIPDII